MGHSGQSFDQRLGVMGDIAEQAAAAHLEEIGRSYVPYGLNRPPLRMDMLPARIRHTPDFLTSRGFVEAKGFGRDQTLKLKFEDYGCFEFWHQVHPLELYAWDSHNERGCLVEWSTVRDWPADARVEIGVFPEGKPYLSVPAAVIFEDDHD